MVYTYKLSNLIRATIKGVRRHTWLEMQEFSPKHLGTGILQGSLLYVTDLPSSRKDEDVNRRHGYRHLITALVGPYGDGGIGEADITQANEHWNGALAPQLTAAEGGNAK